MWGMNELDRISNEHIRGSNGSIGSNGHNQENERKIDIEMVWTSYREWNR